MPEQHTTECCKDGVHGDSSIFRSNFTKAVFKHFLLCMWAWVSHALSSVKLSPRCSTSQIMTVSGYLHRDFDIFIWGCRVV